MSLTEAMKAADEDNRAFRRYPVSMTVLVRAVSEEEAKLTEQQTARRCPTASAVVMDVSLSGLVFVSPRQFPLGSEVELQVSLGGQVFSLRACIKRSQVVMLPGRRAYRCAGQFLRGDSVAKFIPAMAKYLHLRYGATARASASR